MHVHVINADPKTWIPKMNEIRWNTRYFYVFMQKTSKFEIYQKRKIEKKRLKLMTSCPVSHVQMKAMKVDPAAGKGNP